MSEDNDSSRGFRVTDRRRFSDEGEARQDANGIEEAREADRQAQVPPAAEPPRVAEGSSEALHARAPEEPVNFSTFVLGLSTQALLHLGEMEDPLSGRVERDLAAAKHVIDILGILKDKTKGNLEHAEEQLLEAVLYDLRMRYVELARGSSRGG